jgi:hypothetical protein
VPTGHSRSLVRSKRFSNSIGDAPLYAILSLSLSLSLSLAEFPPAYEFPPLPPAPFALPLRPNQRGVIASLWKNLNFSKPEEYTVLAYR